MRYDQTQQVNQIDIESSEYINLLNTTTEIQYLTFLDAINMFLTFFSLFYYTAQTSESLHKLSIFFVTVGKEILNTMLILSYLILVFSVALFVQLEQRIKEVNNFSTVIVNTLSLSLGSNFIDEDDSAIDELGSGFYYFVRFYFSGVCLFNFQMLLAIFIVVYIIAINAIFVIIGKEFVSKKLTAEKEKNIQKLPN